MSRRFVPFVDERDHIGRLRDPGRSHSLRQYKSVNTIATMPNMLSATDTTLPAIPSSARLKTQPLKALPQKPLPLSSKSPLKSPENHFSSPQNPQITSNRSSNPLENPQITSNTSENPPSLFLYLYNQLRLKQGHKEPGQREEMGRVRLKIDKLEEGVYKDPQSYEYRRKRKREQIEKMKEALTGKGPSQWDLWVRQDPGGLPTDSAPSSELPSLPVVMKIKPSPRKGRERLHNTEGRLISTRIFARKKLNSQ